MDPAVRRLAVPVEDHDLAAGDFEGVHEGSVRGTGAVIIWDEGPAQIVRDEPGHLTVELDGSKLGAGSGSRRPARSAGSWSRRATSKRGPAPISRLSGRRACARAGPGKTWSGEPRQAGSRCRGSRARIRPRRPAVRC